MEVIHRAGIEKTWGETGENTSKPINFPLQYADVNWSAPLTTSPPH